MKKPWGEESDNDEDLIQVRGNKPEGDQVDNSQALVIKNQEEEEKRKKLFKNPHARQLAVDAGQRAAKVRIIFLY
jgi:hypothetical protein